MAATINGVSFELKYLFEAHFRDGSFLKQTPEDRSAIEPERSAYFDVLARQDELLFFGIYDGRHTFVVDLRDGHFEIDGTSFQAQPVSSNCIPEGGLFRLLYFRDHQQDFIASADGLAAAGHRVAYRLGWEYTVGGRKWQQTIVVR